MYKAAWDMQKLSENYLPFVSAFTYASWGYINLDLEGSTVKPESPVWIDSRYEAYDRLIKPINAPLEIDLRDTVQNIIKTITIKEDRFNYQIGKRLLNTTVNSLKPHYDAIFDLPSDWGFTDYTLVDFRKVAKILMAFGYIHFLARVYAATHGCVGLGYSDSIKIFRNDELIWQLSKFSNCKFEIVKKIVRDLEYGTRGIKSPDPAIQPIIKLSHNEYGLMPNLISNSAIERNLLILMNCIPSEKKIYLRLVEQKEEYFRKKILNELSGLHIRHYSGNIGGHTNLPDIDLALIDDQKKYVFVLEIKWFIEPAEVREVIEKSDEIAKGISQLLTLRGEYQRNPNLFYNTLQVRFILSVSISSCL